MRDDLKSSVPARIRKEAKSIQCSIPSYAPLVVRSYYSFLTSALSIEDILALAKQHGLSSVALTDIGNLHGAAEFAQKAKTAGIRPVLGAEIRVQGKPVWLYVENKQGYANLCRILSEKKRGAIIRQTADSEYPPEETIRAPDLLPEQLGALAEGLVAVARDDRLAHFFPGRFYKAIHSAEEAERLWVSSYSFPLAPILPVHCATPTDRWKFDLLQSIRTRTLLKQAHPEKLTEAGLHFRSPKELQQLFGRCLRAMEQGREILERCCHFELPFGKPQFPAYKPEDGSSAQEFLRRLVMDGLRYRYRNRWEQWRPQVEEELGIISEVGYEEYFLVVWDLLQECRRKGISWLTRGSAADSLVCYCLGISDVCPIRFDLYFRRFLNKERMALNKLPDIDVDFPHDRKDDVIDLLFEKYGENHCAIVGGFSTYQARGAVGDVAKVLGVSEYQIRRFTEHFPWGRARNLEEKLSQSQECRDLPIQEEPYRTALRMAEFLDGFPRYPKMHPCGVVLSRQPMHELTPTFFANKGYPTTHYDMDAVETMGLVKMDILAQGGLAVMRDVKRMLEGRGIAIDLERMNIEQSWNDPAVWDMLAGGGSRAVHHIESPAMVGLCRQCSVHEIDGLVAIVSVIRPGAANEQKKTRFVRRYQGLEPVTYPHPSLESCLKSTFGLVVYEEHVLQICEAFAGLSAGRADVLRRALGKEKVEVIKEICVEFFDAARQRGHPEDIIAEVWNLIIGFAGYAFCKAHSTAYAVEAYQSAWLKKYYPTEFMAAVLTNGKGFYDPLVYVLECHRMGIRLLPPSVNEPGPEFGVRGTSALNLKTGSYTAESPETDLKLQCSGECRSPSPSVPFPRGEGGMFAGFGGKGDLYNRSQFAIRVPATRIKGLGNATIERLLKERKRGAFASFKDFYTRVMPLPEEMELLIRAGALDEFGLTRCAQFWETQLLRHSFGSLSSGGQTWLIPPPGAERLSEVPLEEPSRRQKLEWESELLGFPVTGHPLDLFDNIAWETYCPVSNLGQFTGQKVVACGLVIEQRLHHQTTGEMMKFLTLADWTGIVETELFASTYRSYGLATVRYPVLEVTATVEPYENGRGFSLRVHRAGKPRTV